MTKTFSKLEIEGHFLNIIKSLYAIPAAYILYCGKRLKASLRQGQVRMYIIITSI